MPAKVIPLKAEKKKKFTRDKVYPILFLNNETGVYYVREHFKRDKIPSIFKSTKESKKGAANTAAKNMIQAWRNKHLGIEDGGKFDTAITRVQGKLISEILDEIAKEYTPEQRPNTRKQHKLYLQQYIREHCGHIGIDAYSLEDFDAWINRIRLRVSPRTGRQRKTFKNYAKYMNVVWSFAYRKKYTKHRIQFPNPDKRIKRELEEKPRKELTPIEREILELKRARCMTSKEIEAVWPLLNETWQLRFRLSLNHIMRFMEAGKLEWDRVDLETGLITLRPQDVKTGSKTDKGRAFYVDEETLKLLRRRKAGLWKRGKGEKHHADSPFVFPNFRDPMRPASDNQRIWKQALSGAGIKRRVVWHDLRHTALTFALLGDPDASEVERNRMKQDPLHVSEYAGVSMTVIQKVYLHTKAEHTRGVPRAFGSLKLKSPV